jgi:uncharacterized protein YPO0396
VTTAGPPSGTATARVRAPGFRLVRLEVLNWGTFDRRVWGLDVRGENTLLTGDIGSGKSTLVDAVTTLLVPPQRLAYNRAAGADARERTLRSYVLGYYKSERSEAQAGARAVALRDRDAHSVVLARFRNDALGQTVTLAQVFWTKDVEGQPARMYVVADEPLDIATHFVGFGPEVAELRRRLRRAGAEVHDSFPPYGASFRRRFGIDDEQALELFHQTVSMKSVGNLTDFVRQHMLPAYPVEPRIEALLSHFDDLRRAHEAVLKARSQIERLEPIVADCGRHADATRETEALRACRDGLRPWFARLKAQLVERRRDRLEGEITALRARGEQIAAREVLLRGERDELRRSIAANGGDRLDGIRATMNRLRGELEQRRARADKYLALAAEIGLSTSLDATAFAANRASLATAREETEGERATAQNAATEARVAFQRMRELHAEVAAEIESLRQRRSNIPRRMLDVRDALADATGIEPAAIPFAGELMRVVDGEEAWEGAIERVAHGFALSLLVADEHYAAVSQWVDRTHVGDRLVYFRVRGRGGSAVLDARADSLARKIAVRVDSPFYAWLDAEVARRFDYACCETLDQFRREPLAITRTGQLKGKGDRHEKDDRHRIDDRSRYVLGWTNEAKIEALLRQRRDLEVRIQRVGDDVAEADRRLTAVSERLGKLGSVAAYDDFRELDWHALAVEIDALERERADLESGSDVLRTLQTRLAAVDGELTELEGRSKQNALETGGATSRFEEAERLLAECREAVDTASDAQLASLEALDRLVVEALGERVPASVESCDPREKDVREWIQTRIDTGGLRLSRLAERIVGAMKEYCRDFPLDTRETDASVGAAGEYASMLERLRGDDLPRFEAKFKELLNENTIREIASFQSQLHRERESIRDRIQVINDSLRSIAYNPGRYVVLEAAPTADVEVRDFQRDLRACTEGALTGSGDEAYSEAKFLQVKRIVERFRGREGTTELDQRWTRKVTDVRSWFTFSASERWREDDREHEHYTDSGGKSGGQKEKLAYTVLAASLSYQYGLDRAAERPRSFRFVVIDEAFGRGSDESTRYGLSLFERLGLQLLVVTPLQKIRVIEPYVTGVGFVHNEDGRRSMIRNLTIEEYRAERAARIG